MPHKDTPPTTPAPGPPPPHLHLDPHLQMVRSTHLGFRPPSLRCLLHGQVDKAELNSPQGWSGLLPGCLVHSTPQRGWGGGDPPLSCGPWASSPQPPLLDCGRESQSLGQLHVTQWPSKSSLHSQRKQPQLPPHVGRGEDGGGAHTLGPMSSVSTCSQMCAKGLMCVGPAPWAWAVAVKEPAFGRGPRTADRLGRPYRSTVIGWEQARGGRHSARCLPSFPLPPAPGRHPQDEFLPSAVLSLVHTVQVHKDCAFQPYSSREKWGEVLSDGIF